MWMLWVGGHHDRGIHGGLGADSRRYAGVCQGLGGYSLPKTLRIGQNRGYSHAPTPRISQNRWFWAGPGCCPPAPGAGPPGRGSKFGQNRWVFNNSPIRDRNCTLSTMVSRKRVPRGTARGPIFGAPDSPRFPPGRPPAKIGKIQGFQGSAKIEGFGGMAIWGTAILGYARGVGIMMGYAVGVGTMMGDAMGGIYSGWTLYSVMEHRGTGGARPTGRYIDQ